MVRHMIIKSKKAQYKYSNEKDKRYRIRRRMKFRK